MIPTAPATFPELDVIDEQAHFVVVNKPENINFHDEDALGEGLFSKVKSQLNLAELYPVHRLDKMTSGLIIFAKTLEAARAFQQLFEQHLVEKYYLAISDKKPTKKQGLIKGDMAKSRRGMWKILRSTENPAISQFFSYPIMSGYRLFLVKPHSGKTHQIRVALSSIGSPIVGDKAYHSPSPPEKTQQTQQNRGYLHAYSLRFTLFSQQYQYQLMPMTGELYCDEMTQAKITEIAQPWHLKWPKIK